MYVVDIPLLQATSDAQKHMRGLILDVGLCYASLNKYPPGLSLQYLWLLMESGQKGDGCRFY